MEKFTLSRTNKSSYETEGAGGKKKKKKKKKWSFMRHLPSIICPYIRLKNTWKLVKLFARKGGKINSKFLLKKDLKGVTLDLLIIINWKKLMKVSIK